LGIVVTLRAFLLYVVSTTGRGDVFGEYWFIGGRGIRRCAILGKIGGEKYEK
jgi:hypothetical protein